MPDANVDLGGSDLFGLTTTAGFHAQGSDTEPYSTEELALASDGDKACTNTHDSGSNFTARYKYCGSTLGTNLGANLTAFGTVVGTGAAAKIPTGMTIDFPGPGQQAEITITGHNHTTNNHSASTNAANLFSLAGIIPAGAGVGVPDLITVAGETNSVASRSSASLDFAVNHIDKEGNSGHFVGESITCRCDLSVDYEGNASTATAGNWEQILVATSDANEDLDTSSLTAHQYLDAT